MRNALYTRWSVLKNSQFYATSVYCLHRSGSIFCAPISSVKWKCINFKCYSTGEKTKKKNFYRVLGVSPKATQAQIKNAFYKLSITHHPDKHKGSEESHDKFQEISEAYNVVGNQATRKQYDRELIVEGQLRAEHTHAYKPPSSVKKPPGSIYNFDEWTKAHYSNQLNKNQRSRLKKEAYDEEESNTATIGTGTMRITVIFIVVATLIVVYCLQRIKESQNEHLEED